MATQDSATPLYTAQELGFPSPQPPNPTGLPPGDGGYSIPNFLSFSGLVQSAARAYRYSFDEAIRDSPTNALAMRRDAVLMGALRKRQRPTALLTWHITAQDETNEAETEAAALVTDLINEIPRFQKMKMLLLEAIWYGKFAIELAWEWGEYKGQQVLKVRDYIPINGDKIRFKWDGTPGFLVYAGYPGTKEATDWGLAHFVTPDERMQYIIHEHEPDDADWTEMEMAGMIHGVGVRGRLYWNWWMKQQVFGQLMNYLHRFANGLTIFYYDASNEQAKKEATAAARAQFQNTALLYPRWNSTNPDINKVERMEVGSANPTLLWNLVSQYFDSIAVKFILGQVLSMDAEATGMGSGVAELHGEGEDEINKYDAIDLAETLQTDLVDIFYRYNAPGIPPGKFEFEIDAPNSEALMQYGEILYEWGVPLDEEQAYKISQWSKPKPGGGIITKLGQMQPAAINTPEGVPVAGDVAQGQGQPGATSPEEQAQMAAQGQQLAAAGQAQLDGNGQPVSFRRGKIVVNRIPVKRKYTGKRRIVIT